MVIDSSALVAIILDEPERPRFEDAILSDSPRLVSAVTKLESSIVLFGRRGRPMLDELDLLFHRIAATIVLSSRSHFIPWTPPGGISLLLLLP